MAVTRELFGVRRTLRRGTVAVLKVVADALRDSESVGTSEASVAAGTGSGATSTEPEPTPAPAEPSEPAVDDAADEAFDDALLMAGAGMMSGDLSAVMASRQSEAAERATAGEAPPGPSLEALRDKVIDALHTIYDPEIPVDIYELGLIYDVEVDEDAGVDVRMTLTSPNCPAAQSLPAEVERKVGGTDGVSHASVEVVFDPPWTPDLMSEEARLELNV